MGLLPEIKLYYKGRSNVQLIVSEGNTPADKWLASAATNAVTQFKYAFGPNNNQEVVIPKGKILSGAGTEYDIETEKRVPRVTIANATSKPIGVSGHNVYMNKRGSLTNGVTIVTRDYIRLPYFFSTATANTAATAAAAIKWGAAWYESDSTDKDAIIGKYVVSDANGNFEITDTATLTNLVVGTVMAVETDAPPAGYLQFFMGMVQSDYDDFIEATSYIPAAGRPQGSGFGDIGQYPFSSDNGSVGYQKNKLANAKASFSDYIKGIPFLTDGYFKARGTYLYAGSTAGDATAFDKVWTSEKVTLTGNKFECATDYTGAVIYVTLPDDLAVDALEDGETVANYPELANLANSISVYLTNDAALATATEADFAKVLDPTDHTIVDGSDEITATKIDAKNLFVDYNNNMLAIYLTELIAADSALVKNELVIQATTIKDAVSGTPTLWDFKGSVGEVRILLSL